MQIHKRYVVFLIKPPVPSDQNSCILINGMHIMFLV
uniref:Uncharacterized protein n=1 Tax=Arundo donax TaxID=35708 RepID=A0A0A9EBQ7_ARUDO